MESTPVDVETPSKQREKLLNSLADELEQLCAKTKSRKTSVSNRRKPSDITGFESDSRCNCYDDLSERITGRKMKCPEHSISTGSASTGLQLELLSPSGFGSEFMGQEYIESPISPSLAMGRPIESSRGNPHERQSLEDHQICFGMDLSLGDSKARIIFGADGNGNRNGTNLRNGQRGIFPVAHIYEVDIEEELFPTRTLVLDHFERDTFHLTLLGAIEVAHHKGNDILVQAVNKVLNLYQNKEEFVIPRPVIMDVSFKGIHLIDKSKGNLFRCPKFDYFYTLQNISFCGAHPKQLRYFGFVTKHPLLPKFACHVFLSQTSTQPIVEAIGRAFKKSYDEYMAFAHPTEDIFLE